MDNINIQGAKTTADSSQEGRMKVSVSGCDSKKRKILKKLIKSKQ
jgi:hypothetical protein